MLRSAFWALMVTAACSSGGSGGAAGGSAGAAGSGGADSGTAGEGGAAGSPAVDAGPETGTTKPVVEFVTSMGMLAIALEPELMPITTENFLSYVDDGFFDGTIIHRVIPNFVIQGGGYEPGLLKKSTKPPIVLETHPELTHVYGAISMARTNVPDSATSQFFVVNAPAGAHGLDGDYAAFGSMLEGSEVLAAISGVETTTTLSGHEDVPVEDVVVVSAKRR
jgi:cyclophilin family peptidyl-prolyl cis-trans isomerase